MIFSLLKKYWKNIVDALIIIALVVTVYVLNPWGIFNGGLRTHGTANNVTAIREIGELITAEYYGEAISTINQAKLQLIYADNINARADILFKDLKQELLSIHAEKLSKPENAKKEGFWQFKWFRRAQREKKSTLSDISKELNLDVEIKNDSLLAPVLEYYWMITTNSGIQVGKSTSTERDKVLWMLYQEIVNKTENLSDKDFDNYMQDGLPAYNGKLFSDYYYDRKRETLNNRQELSMIGRGWVKAGFNFGKLDESNFYFDKEQGIVHLFGIHAEILNADINPWFIPEKKIPGFQIIEANNKVDFYDAVKVKAYCIEKLRKMALDAGILQQAEIQGKETLKNFISLLTGTEVKDVYFHYDKFTVLSREILNDEFISYEESRMLDTLIAGQVDSILKLDAEKTNFSANQKYKDVKMMQMQAVITNMKNTYFEEKGHFYNRLSSLVFRVTADSIITGDELKEIQDARWNLATTLFKPGSRNDVENHLWYNNPLEFINEYNRAIDEIGQHTRRLGNLKTQSFADNRKFNEFAGSINDTLKISTRRYDKEILFTWLDTPFAPTVLEKLKYPVNLAFNWSKLLEGKKYMRSVQINKQDTRDTLFISPLIARQFTSSGIAQGFKALPVHLDKDNYWRIATPTSLNPEQKLALEYYINYYKSNRAGFFTRANRKLKEYVTPEKLRSGVENLRNVRNGFNSIRQGD